MICIKCGKKRNWEVDKDVWYVASARHIKLALCPSCHKLKEKFLKEIDTRHREDYFTEEEKWLEENNNERR